MNLKSVYSIIVATIWISLSEFVRNELLFKDIWVEHYQIMGLNFSSEPLNGMIWVFWSLLYAIFIFSISRKFSLKNTTFISWFAGFVLMWVVVANMDVLPFRILPYAVPLSFLESFIAVWITLKISPKDSKEYVCFDIISSYGKPNNQYNINLQANS